MIFSDREYGCSLGALVASHLGQGVVSGTFTGAMLAVGSVSVAVATSGWACFSLVDMFCGIGGRLVASSIRDNANSRAGTGDVSDTELQRIAQRQFEQARWSHHLALSALIDVATGICMVGVCALFSAGLVAGWGVIASLAAVRCGLSLNRVYQSTAWGCLKLHLGNDRCIGLRRTFALTGTNIEESACSATAAVTSFCAYQILKSIPSHGFGCLHWCAVASLVGSLLAGGTKASIAHFVV